MIPSEREKRVKRFMDGLNTYTARDMASHMEDKTFLQVVNIAKCNEGFEKIIKQFWEANRQARTVGGYNGKTGGGKNRNHTTQS